MWEQKADVFQPTCSSRFLKIQAGRNFLIIYLCVLHTKCHKEWFKNTLCWFHHLQKKVKVGTGGNICSVKVQAENEGAQGERRSVVVHKPHKTVTSCKVAKRFCVALLKWTSPYLFLSQKWWADTHTTRWASSEDEESSSSTPCVAQSLFPQLF